MKETMNRKMYKKIKTMDRREMAEYLTNLYQEGINAGRKRMVTPEQINEEIKKVKGIGEVKRQAIMEKITQLYE
ncbi:hypothetical protein DWW96_10925 [Eubacterium sp. AF17-7]|uniref:hypothetical protein n=1 Tax=Eubacterium sp. AF17-7 TaxID=2293105 RepID=UPI000E54A8F8|nr:hypothetical protein [Eubacterium sp. AF17-7]RGG63447.1 hypothetical protein DWW96_10925 [Eubacterium sp. AF17-7]